MTDITATALLRQNKFTPAKLQQIRRPSGGVVYVATFAGYEYERLLRFKNRIAGKNIGLVIDEVRRDVSHGTALLMFRVTGVKA